MDWPTVIAFTALVVIIGVVAIFIILKSSRTQGFIFKALVGHSIASVTFLISQILRGWSALDIFYVGLLFLFMAIIYFMKWREKAHEKTQHLSGIGGGGGN